jgi:hypothetical protein
MLDDGTLSTVRSDIAPVTGAGFADALEPVAPAKVKRAR